MPKWGFVVASGGCLLVVGIAAVWALTWSTPIEAGLDGAAVGQALEAAPPGPRAPRTLDDALAEVAQDVPGFGGMFYDERGDLNVYLLDPGQQVPAETSIASVFGPGVAAKGRSTFFAVSMPSLT